MTIVSITQAKAQLSRLVEEVAKGELVIITISGKPLVKVTPIDAPEPKAGRGLGFLKGQIAVPDDFDTMFADEIEEMFNGEARA